MLLSEMSLYQNEIIMLLESMMYNIHLHWSLLKYTEKTHELTNNTNHWRNELKAFISNVARRTFAPKDNREKLYRILFNWFTKKNKFDELCSVEDIEDEFIDKGINPEYCAEFTAEFEKELPIIIKKICEGKESVREYVKTLGCDKEEYR